MSAIAKGEASRRVEEFKNRVEAEWNVDETAVAWQKNRDLMKAQFNGVTEALIDVADLRSGMAVLDLASGVGEPSIQIARRIAPDGTVTATDLSRGMIEFLKANAVEEGVANLDAEVCDAHDLPFADASFDRVTCRFGAMFFGEVGEALAEIRRVLKPGGKMALAVWGASIPGSYFGAMATPFMRRLAAMPDPDGPSPVRFAEPGKLAGLVRNAGFKDVQETVLNLPAPFRGSPEAMLAFMMEVAAPFRRMAATLSEADYRAAEEEVYGNLRPLYDGTDTNVTAPVVLVTGTV